MRKYTYQARNSDDRPVHGIIEGKNVRGARESLIDQGLIPLEVLPQQKAGMEREIDAKELAIFCRQLSMVLQSDITTMRAIPMLVEQTEDRRTRRTLQAIGRAMEQGESFSDAVAERFGPLPRYLINMVQIGETSGTLDVVMRQLSEYYEKENRTHRKVRSATTYPIILGIMMLVVLGMLMVQVLPIFNGILMGMGTQLPAVTRALMGAGEFLAHWLVPIVLGLLVLIAALNIWGRTQSGHYFVGMLQVKVPPFKRYHVRLYTSRFARSLGLLLKSGVNISTGMQFMEHLLGNAYVERKLTALSDKLEKGAGLYQSLVELDFFPPLLLRMVHVGEETGKIDEMLFSSANLFDEEVDEAIERITALIEPVLIIILAVIVGFVLMSVMLPMIDIMATIG